MHERYQQAVPEGCTNEPGRGGVEENSGVRLTARRRRNARASAVRRRVLPRRARRLQGGTAETPSIPATPASVDFQWRKAAMAFAPPQKERGGGVQPAARHRQEGHAGANPRVEPETNRQQNRHRSCRRAVPRTAAVAAGAVLRGMPLQAPRRPRGSPYVSAVSSTPRESVPPTEKRHAR